MSYAAADNRYGTMKFRRTGKSGLVLPEISLGLWHNFGGNDSRAKQRAILRRAFDLGITHFDLANNYGPPPGSAETNFGELFARDFSKHRDEMIISTKAGYTMWAGPYGDFGSRKYLLSSLDQSLQRMDIDYVDIFYSHRFDPNTPLEETMGALATAVHSGKALYAGISNYDAQQTRNAKAILESKGVPLLINQSRYSMFDRTVENSLLDTLGTEGVGAIVFSPLAQGLLTDRYLKGSAPKRSRAAKNLFLKETEISEEYLHHARALSEIAMNRGQTLSQLALSWVLRKPTVTSALIGASSVKQLEQNVAALKAPALSSNELQTIDLHAIHGLVLKR